MLVWPGNKLKGNVARLSQVVSVIGVFFSSFCQHARANNGNYKHFYEIDDSLIACALILQGGGKYSCYFFREVYNDQPAVVITGDDTVRTAKLGHHFAHFFCQRGAVGIIGRLSPIRRVYQVQKSDDVFDRHTIQPVDEHLGQIRE